MLNNLFQRIKAIWFSKVIKNEELTLQALLSAPDDSIDNESFIEDYASESGAAIIPYENVIDGNYGFVRGQMVELLYKTYRNDHVEYEREYNLFQFTKFDDKYTLDNLEKSVIIRNQPKSFNDPLDPIMNPWLKLYRKAIKRKSVHTLVGNAEKAVEHYRIRCFSYEKGLEFGDNHLLLSPNQSIEGISPLLWAHYADGYRGICLKCKLRMKDLQRQYNTNDSYIQLRPVKYVKNLDIRQPITLSDALVLKGKYWEYENEIRLIYYSQRKQEEHFPIQVEITDIYLGVSCSDEVRQRIQRVIKGRMTKLHKMVIDPNDITKLKSIELH